MSITVEINNRRPVELLDYAQSMSALGLEYKRFLGNGENAATPEEVKLYVKTVRAGSIITELVAIAPVAIPFMEHADTVFEYAKHLKVMLDWLSGKSDAKPEVVEKVTLQNLSEIVEPIAKDNGSQMNIAAVNVTGNVTVNINCNHTEANAIQNSIRRAIDDLKEPVTGIKTQVLMYWAQARNSPASKSGDKVRIESIYKGDVKVIFADETLKAKMLLESAYPFANAYIVDVVVETIDGKPALYKVFAIHETMSREQ